MALKPCPDCGATTMEEYGPMLKRVRPFEKHRYYYMIQCQKCHKETKLFKTEEEAVEEWNKTAEDEKIKLKSCPFCGSKEGTAGETTDTPTDISAVCGWDCSGRSGEKRRGGETMPGKRIDLRPKSVKEETRAMEAAGRRILAAVNAVQDASAALSDVLRREADTWHGEVFDQKTKELRHMATNITMNAGRMKLIAGSMTRPESQRRRD